MLRISQLFLFVCIVFSLQAQDATFSGKVFLQGVYDANTSWIQVALVKHSSYDSNNPTAFLHYVLPARNITHQPRAVMVDWTLVDIRISPYTAIGSLAAILYADGTIRDACGDSELSNPFINYLHICPFSITST